MKLYILFLGEACIDKGRLISPGVDDGKAPLTIVRCSTRTAISILSWP